MDEFRYQNTYELTKEEVSRVFGGRPPVRGTCQLMETIEGRGTTEADPNDVGKLLIDYLEGEGWPIGAGQGPYRYWRHIEKRE